jgi:hypothetical protein
MVEVTANKCFVLWTLTHRGKVTHDATVFTSAHAAITEGERQREKGTIKDYNYSVVMEPQIGGEPARPKMPLTDLTREHRVEL